MIFISLPTVLPCESLFKDEAMTQSFLYSQGTGQGPPQRPVELMFPE